jgi:hypothetical protein
MERRDVEKYYSEQKEAERRQRLGEEFVNTLMKPRTQEGIPYVYDEGAKQTRPSNFMTDFLLPSEQMSYAPVEEEPDLAVRGFSLVGKYTPTDYQKAGLELVNAEKYKPIGPTKEPEYLVKPTDWGFNVKEAGFNEDIPIVGGLASARYQEVLDIETRYREKIKDAKTNEEKIQLATGLLGKVFLNKEKAIVLILRGDLYAGLANALRASGSKEEALAKGKCYRKNKACL